MEQFTFGEHSLHGRIYYPNKSVNQAFLITHGWSSDQYGTERVLAQELCTAGSTVMTYDLRAHGQSRGQQSFLTANDFLDDAYQAVKKLKELVGEEMPIGLIGSSFGAYLSAVLSNKVNVSHLIMRAPANYPDHMLHQPVVKMVGILRTNSILRSSPLKADSTQSLHALSKFMGPSLIVESGLDEVIPKQTITNYLQANPKTDHIVMPSAKHSISTSEEHCQEYAAVAKNWLQTI